MPNFLAYRPKTKTKRPVSFKTSKGEVIRFDAKRKPLRRSRIKF